MVYELLLQPLNFFEKGEIAGEMVLKQFTTIMVVEPLLFTQSWGFLPGVPFQYLLSSLVLAYRH